MKKFLILIAVLVCFTTEIKAQSTGAFFDISNLFFRKYVNKNNEVDYQNLKVNSDLLNIIIDYSAKLNLKNESKEVNKAFWINIYNLIVIKNVLDNYPLKSVQDIPGFFKETEFLIAGQQLTLDDIENTILREMFKDPGIHFVLSSGAVGSPPLLDHAYMPTNIDVQIKDQTIKMINNVDFVKIDRKEKNIELPKIFEWYTKDFVTYYTNEIDFLNLFLEKKLTKDFKTKIYEFDWALNRVR
jgi:Protein of unknown function, DUF547